MSGPIADLLADVTLLQVVLWIAGIAAIITALVKAWPVVKRGVQLIDTLGDLPETLTAIRSQVENSHDTNLRDELDGIRDDLSSLHDTAKALAAWQAKHEAKSDAALHCIDALEQKGTTP